VDIEDRKVIPSMALKRPASVPFDEDSIPPPERDESSSHVVEMAYTNAKGEQSFRRLICRKIEGHGSAELVSGYCCQTEQYKTFRIDRISELSDYHTGELLDPFSHFSHLRLTGAMMVGDKVMTALARALVFLAKCDGEYHPMEEAAIEAALVAYVIRFGGSDLALEKAVANNHKLAPDGHDFVRCMGKFSKHPDKSALARLVLDHMGLVSDADGKQADEEFSWMLDVRTDLLRLVA